MTARNRDQRVIATIACPICDAPRGEPCRRIASGTHTDRRKLWQMAQAGDEYMASHALRFGPYAPPRVRVGEFVTCQMRGLVRVRDWVESGRIMWPRGLPTGPSPGRPSLIIMGDLVIALRHEAAVAVMEHWGVSAEAVRRWRRALHISRNTDGTRAVLAENGHPSIADHAAEGAAALNRNPESRATRAAHHAATLRSKPGWADHMRQLAHKRKTHAT